MKTLFKALFFSLAIVFFVSCAQDDDYEVYDYQEQFKTDSTLIVSYVNSNHPDAFPVMLDDFNTCIYVDVTEEGTENTDLSPSATSTVECKYKGYLLDGTVFDETDEGETISFSLSQVIGGWTLAFQELSEGDKATIMIPSYYGYGYYGIGSIPGNSVLVFDVELVSFE